MAKLVSEQFEDLKNITINQTNNTTDFLEHERKVQALRNIKVARGASLALPVTDIWGSSYVFPPTVNMYANTLTNQINSTFMMKYSADGQTVCWMSTPMSGTYTIWSLEGAQINGPVWQTNTPLDFSNVPITTIQNIAAIDMSEDGNIIVVGRKLNDKLVILKRQNKSSPYLVQNIDVQPETTMVISSLVISGDGRRIFITGTNPILVFYEANDDMTTWTRQSLTERGLSANGVRYNVKCNFDGSVVAIATSTLTVDSPPLDIFKIKSENIYTNVGLNMLPLKPSDLQGFLYNYRYGLHVSRDGNRIVLIGKTWVGSYIPYILNYDDTTGFSFGPKEGSNHLYSSLDYLTSGIDSLTNLFLTYDATFLVEAYITRPSASPFNNRLGFNVWNLETPRLGKKILLGEEVLSTTDAATDNKMFNAVASLWIDQVNDFMFYLTDRTLRDTASSRYYNLSGGMRGLRLDAVF